MSPDPTRTFSCDGARQELRFGGLGGVSRTIAKAVDVIDVDMGVFWEADNYPDDSARLESTGEVLGEWQWFVRGIAPCGEDSETARGPRVLILLGLAPLDVAVLFF